jgi:hypothetical protein
VINIRTSTQPRFARNHRKLPRRRKNIARRAVPRTCRSVCFLGRNRRSSRSGLSDGDERKKLYNLFMEILMSKSISSPDASINISTLGIALLFSIGAYQTLLRGKQQEIVCVERTKFRCLLSSKSSELFFLLFDCLRPKGFGSAREAINHVRKSALHVFIMS